MQIAPQKEFDRQLQTLLSKGYPEMLNTSTESFTAQIEKMRGLIPDDLNIDIKQGKIPFIIVAKSPVGESEKLMELVEREGKKGFSKMFPHDAKEFHAIDAVNIPDSFVYLIIGIDRGKETINLPPNEAFEIINNQKRSPLTIDEGIAFVTQYPEALIKNNCFSLLASRCPGNKRVPAIWINAEKRPNLGWCWDGNPHTWLGSASCVKRISV